MGTSDDHHCLRCMVTFFNAITFFGGAFITAWGIYLIVVAKRSAGSLPMTYPALTTTFGILIFVAAFLGCFGSRKNSVCLLSVSCVIISILVVCEIVVATLILVYQGTFVTVIGETLKYEIQNPQNATIDREMIYNLQDTFKCCGGTGPSDWDGEIPASCCANGNSNCQSPYQTGCAQAMYTFMRGPFIGVASSILVISLIQLCGVICIACLASKVGDYEKV